MKKEIKGRKIDRETKRVGLGVDKMKKRVRIMAMGGI